MRKTLPWIFGLWIGISFSYPGLAQNPAPAPGGTPAVSSPQTPPAPEKKEDDFEYYKKYGRSSKAYNDAVKSGFEAYDQGDCEKALSYLKDAAKAGCDDPIVLFKLAACSELQGSYYTAAQYYKQAEDGLKILKAPHRYSKDFYEAYGRTLYMNKKNDEALTYFVKAAEVGTPNFGLFYFLGELSLAKKDNVKALEYFNKALSQPLEGANPAQLGRIYAALGKAFLELKDWSKAIQYLDTGLRYAPTDADLQQARYKAGEMKRQQELFQLMQGGMESPLPPMRPQNPAPGPAPAPPPAPGPTSAPPPNKM